MELRRREFMAAGIAAVGSVSLPFWASADALAAAAPGFTPSRQRAYVAGFAALAASRANILDPLDADDALAKAQAWYAQAPADFQRTMDLAMDSLDDLARGGLAGESPDRGLDLMLGAMHAPAKSRKADVGMRVATFVNWIESIWPTGQAVLAR